MLWLSEDIRVTEGGRHLTLAWGLSVHMCTCASAHACTHTPHTNTIWRKRRKEEEVVAMAVVNLAPHTWHVSVCPSPIGWHQLQLLDPRIPILKPWSKDICNHYKFCSIHRNWTWWLMATMLLLWLQFVCCQLWDSVRNISSPWQGVGRGTWWTLHQPSEFLPGSYRCLLLTSRRIKEVLSLYVTGTWAHRLPQGLAANIWKW